MRDEGVAHGLVNRTAISEAARGEDIHEQGTRCVRAKTRETADIRERVNGGCADGLREEHLGGVENSDS